MDNNEDSLFLLRNVDSFANVTNPLLRSNRFKRLVAHRDNIQ